VWTIWFLLVDITAVNVALPDIERALHASLADLQWVLDALRALPGRPAADRRLARGPLRPPVAVRDRHPRLLIGPGFALVGAGLLLKRGITPESGWTHLIPGFVVAGIGTGLINVPLASTAVAVVEPARAGMASGVNSTFRQVGIATGIAALGSIFASKVSDTVAGAPAGTPLGGRASALGDAVASRPPPGGSRRHSSRVWV
jgi:hypothetical protein